jgi:outer membrane lipoprotein carrier protein
VTVFTCRIARMAMLCLLAMPIALAAAADSGANPGTNALDRFLTGLNTLSADFTQSVTDSHGEAAGAGSGRLLVQRPGKFRWDYTPREPGAQSAGQASRGQLLVADGKNLWFYDRELAQVTVKPVEAALSATPIVLLSGSVAQLHDTFEIAAAAAHDGMDWVEVKPRSTEADFNHAELGFTSGKLVRMVVNDRLGQTVQLDFQHSERNARVDADALRFKPPSGVDVIGTPQG